MNKLNLVVVGFGNMGKIHHKSILKSLICNRPIVVDTDKKVLDGSSDVEFFRSLEEIPKKKIEKLDGAIISSPSSMHLEQADFFINKKIPIMVEKPLTEDFDKSMELINNAKDAKVLLKCGLIELYNPIVEELSKINFEELKFVHFKRHSPSTSSDRKLENIILDLTLHDISVILKIFNPDTIKIVGKELIYNEEVAETAQVLLKINDSFTIFLSTSRQDQEKIRLLEIVDDKASYYCDLKNKYYEKRQSGEVSPTGLKSITESNVLNKIDMLDKPETAEIQLERFLNSIINNELDEDHLQIVEKTHRLAYEILNS